MHRTILTLAVGIYLASVPAAAQPNLLDDASRWTVGSGGQFATEDGVPVLHLVGGAALNDVTFQDGVISFEVRLTHRAAFVGVRFRAGARDAEHVYVRPHRSEEWDAIQYQPIMNGSSTWQLHQGDGFTAPTTLRHGVWVPVRLEVIGDAARVYVDGVDEPAMTIALERGVTEGGISLTSGFRGGGPDGEVPASFRGLSVDHREPAVAQGPMDGMSMDDGFLRSWRVSSPTAADEARVVSLPSASDEKIVHAEARGIVNLNRHFSLVRGTVGSRVVATTVVRAERAAAVSLAFDYSDHVSVFLNGRLLFTGSNPWESRYPYYLGALRPDVLTNELWLDLDQGDNELALVVTEQAFGWGFVARIEPTSNVRVALQ